MHVTHDCKQVQNGKSVHHESINLLTHYSPFPVLFQEHDYFNLKTMMINFIFTASYISTHCSQTIYYMKHNKDFLTPTVP